MQSIRAFGLKAAFALFAVLVMGCPGWAAQPWQILVINQLAPASKGAPAKFATTWADGKTSKVMDGFVVSRGEHLWSLKVVPSEGKCSCKDGKFPFSYRVDQLVASEVGDPKQSKVLLGDTALDSAKAVMRDHQNNCEGIKALPGQPDTTLSYERSKLRLLSNFHGSLGTELVSESVYYGRPGSMVSNDWSAYRLDKDPISRQGKKYLPEGAATEAGSKFQKLAAAERDPFSPGDFSHFILVPAGGGVAVEFGVPGTAEAARNQSRVVRVERGAAPNEDYEKARQAFVSAHPKLIAWDKVSFYSVAPDGSVVVYAQNGNLYWQAPSGSAKLLGPVKDVRGWQWHNGTW